LFFVMEKGGEKGEASECDAVKPEKKLLNSSQVLGKKGGEKM